MASIIDTKDNIASGFDESNTLQIDKLIGRVLKKHVYSKHLYFYDFICYFNDRLEEFSTTSLSSSYTIATIVLKKEAEAVAPSIIAGDVIEISGYLQNYSKVLNQEERPSIVTSIENISILGKWPIEDKGFFSFEVEKMTSKHFKSLGSIDLPFPTLALQCKHDSIHRFTDFLQFKLEDFYGKSNHGITFRESSTCYVKSSDRLVMLYLQPELNYHELLQECITDPILSQCIMRIYPGQIYNTSLFTISHANLYDLMKLMIEYVQNQASMMTIDGLRLHTSPKYISMDIVSYDLTYPWTWQPHKYSHILSIFMCDGLWIASLIQAKDGFIGDLREHKPQVKGSTDYENIEICRAGAKIKEVILRKHWRANESISAEENYENNVAIDIGSSPGGWTWYLATTMKYQQVLSVDKGELNLPTPWPTNISYWKLSGQDAIEKLYQEKLSNPSTFNTIDLYCCDANISPYVTISLFFKCQEYQLLSKHGRFIITLKNIFLKKAEFEQSIKHCQEELIQHGFQNIEIVHLLANTPKETTILGIF